MRTEDGERCRHDKADSSFSQLIKLIKNANKKRERIWFDDESPNLGNEGKNSKLQGQ
jgi:hypothetical protein